MKSFQIYQPSYDKRNEIHYNVVKSSYKNEEELMRQRLRYRRVAREQRDIFQQLEAFITS